MSSGRSRGRARVTPAQPASAATPGSTPLPTAATAAAATASAMASSPPTSASAAAGAHHIPPARVSSPQRAAIPPVEVSAGRGRGMTVAASDSSAASVAEKSGAGGGSSSSRSGSGSGGAGSGVSPTGALSSSESSPPSNSPPHSVSAVGRAVLRGVAQPQAALHADLITAGVADLSLEGQPGGPQREYRPDVVLNTRPASCTSSVGTGGDPVKILANYFEVVNKPNCKLYMYHVDFAPIVDSRRMRLALFKRHEATLFPTNKAFDGSMVYSSTLLQDEVTVVNSMREHDQTMIQMTIKRTGEIVPSSPQFIQLYNVVFRRCLKLYGMKMIDKNYYDMNQRFSIENYNMDLINGFATSIAFYESKLLLCTELTHKLLHKTTVLELLTTLYRSSAGDATRFREASLAQIVGRVVMTRYNDKTYAINDINFDGNALETFEVRGEKISFVDYYLKHYKIQIREIHQPLLIVLPKASDKRRGQTGPIILLPELCILTGVDEQMRTDFRFKKAIDVHTKLQPNDRCNRLTNFINAFKANTGVQNELNTWEMDFSNRPVEIVGRLLPPEKLLFGKGATKQLNEKADWGMEMKGIALLGPVKLDNWIIVYPGYKEGTASDFAGAYASIIRPMGIIAEQPIPIAIESDKPESYVLALKASIKKETQMVVCVVTSKRKDRYDAIKRICCLEIPVPSQVVTTQLLEDAKKRMAVITKVAIQMNVKLGGELWATSVPIKDLMICGVDTYHDSANKKRSVCAFISTSNEQKTRFFSRATFQETHQELSNNFTITVKSACENYQRVNNTLPAKIIIYRDGVSDGQLSQVLNLEIPQIQKAFEMVDSNYKPLLTFIVVKKRGNARFFALQDRNLLNPPCGTVIDTVVTRPEWFDFYLIPQHVTQGTVNPTHFNVVYDTLSLKPEHYQRLSFKLCHMYYNWPGTIRVPAPCQYAHKLAFLVGQSLHKEHHQTLCDKLYYL